MQLKHHLIRKFHESKQAPLWKWVVVIFLVIAMPLFFSFARVMNTQQALNDQAEQEEKPTPN